MRSQPFAEWELWSKFTDLHPVWHDVAFTVTTKLCGKNCIIYHQSKLRSLTKLSVYYIPCAFSLYFLYMSLHLGWIIFVVLLSIFVQSNYSKKWSELMTPIGSHDKGMAATFLLACGCLAKQLHIWARQHLATSHIQKVGFQFHVSPGVMMLPSLWPQNPPSNLPPLHPGPSHNRLQLDSMCSVPRGPLVII